MKRLWLERLERRDLLTVIRLTAWNTLNNPNDQVDDVDFATVLEAIGNETLAGNTRPVDILALQETDALGSGNDSIVRIENVLDSLYPSTDYASAVSNADGGGDATGFVYDTTSVSLLESVEIAPQSLTHTILRGNFRPVDTTGSSDFYVYSVHLKSGNSGSDAAVRADEAAILRNDADLLGEGTPVLFVGDFNLQSSSESAYADLTASGAAQVQDVAGAPGQWSDNLAFRSLHTQNPRDSVDDRFDLQLASGEFFDGVGIEYVDGSYQVFGNNGTHLLNEAIDTGTGADPAVLTALIRASDHLPIIADYEIIATEPQVRIRETGDSTRVAEGNFVDTYHVVLDTVPTANVTVTISPDSQLLTSATELVFTPNNALTPQTIVVSAFDDLAAEGNHSGIISHSIVSADSEYDGLFTSNVAVELVDNDAPVIVINEVDADTIGIDALEFIELYDGGVGNSSLAGMTLVMFAGGSNTAYATFDLAGYATDEKGFFLLGNSAVADVDLVFANGLLQNGADAVALYEGNLSVGAGVTTANLLDAIVYDTNDPDDLGLLALLAAGQPQLNEDENGNKDVAALARVPDGGTPLHTDDFTTQLPTPGTMNAPPPPGVLILQSGTRVDVEEGGLVDSYQIALDTIPEQPVTITVDPDGQSDLGAGAGMPIVLNFTASNALIPQTINVVAVDDGDFEGEHTSLITHTVSSADLTYNGLSVGNIVANVIDNDVLLPPSVVISEIMFNPDSDESAPGVAEWIEVVNTGASQVDLTDWRFDDEDANNWGAIPAGTILAPNQPAVFFDSAFTDATTFRSVWSVPAAALVVGIPWASLANSPSATDEILQLLDGDGMQQDLVNYDDANDWPSDNPDGASISLVDLLSDNNDGINWIRSSNGVDNAIAASGPLFSSDDVGSPGIVPESADFDGDQDIDGFDFLLWQRGFGSVMATKYDGDAGNNRIVDAQDLAVWQNSYSSSGSLSSTSLAIQAAAYWTQLEDRTSGRQINGSDVDLVFDELAADQLNF